MPVVLIVVAAALDTDDVGDAVPVPLFGRLLCLILRRMISIKSQMEVSCTSRRTSALRRNSLISFPPRISAAKSFKGIC